MGRSFGTIRMRPHPESFGGWMTVELIVCIALFAMLLAGLGTVAATSRKLGDVQLMRQQCAAAASAQLDSMTATGAALDASDTARLWPDVELSIDHKPGTGQWGGLTLVQVTARGKAGGQTIEVIQSRYVERWE